MSAPTFTLQAASKAGALLAELEAPSSQSSKAGALLAEQGSKFSTPATTVSNISPDLMNNIDVDLNILSSDDEYLRNSKDLSSIASSLNSQTQAEL